ncbi:hypothetical protein ACQUFY_05740 [Robbsia andropogonis]|uniref:hypothetical protein n=1 Tax=Robbsia andropogonis TaxID=28092 RepID=UPI003D23873D
MSIDNTEVIIDSRDVIARIEELETEVQDFFVVGYNMPGYMPDMEPTEYDDADDAIEALRSYLQERLDELEDDVDRENAGFTAEQVEELRAALDAAPDDNGEIAFTVCGYAYWVVRHARQFVQDERDELATLKALAEQAEGYGDWEHGETLIRESYFETYAQELAEDIGAVQPDMKWPYTCIDWEQAASDLKVDYMEVDIDGVAYLMRA